MKDRVSTKILENGAIRYGVYDDAGTLLRYEYIKPEDEPTQEGTPLNKATLLPDVVAEILGLEQEDPLVKDAFIQLASQNKYVFILTILDPAGQPASGLSITGLDIPMWGTPDTTDEHGQIICLSSSPSPDVSIDLSDYVDVESYSGTLTAADKITYTTITLTASTPGEIAYTSSTSVKFMTDVLVDVHCINGGGNGTDGSGTNTPFDTARGGNGGRGGGQAYATDISPAKNTEIPIMVGAVGGNSSAFGIAPTSNISGGAGAYYAVQIVGDNINNPSTAGTSVTVKKYGTGTPITTCSGGGGGNGIRAASAGGAPYGGAGGAGTASGASATPGTYGNGGGGGGGTVNDGIGAGGAGTPGIVYMTWRFAS